MPHAFVHDGKVYGPGGPITDVEGTPLEARDADAYNAELTRQEVAYWATAPEVFGPAYFHFPADGPHTFAPAEGFPYDCAVCGRHRGIDRSCEDSRRYRAEFYPVLRGAEVRTWTGAVLGRITSARVYRHNFGGRFVALTVKGTNGATYHGRASWDWGQVVTLRKGKG